MRKIKCVITLKHHLATQIDNILEILKSEKLEITEQHLEYNLIVGYAKPKRIETIKKFNFVESITSHHN